MGFLSLVGPGTSALRAADWPTWRADAERSGYTPEQLTGSPALAWSHSLMYQPEPAWPRDDRMKFDAAYEVVVAGDLAVYGSSVDGTVTALDARTGQKRWTFFTGAPVRFAPTFVGRDLYVASDDGYLYCLAAADGSLQAKWRPGPSDAMILGNGKMVSRWPARGGPVVRGGVVYFAAGIWQSDGVYLTAINAATRKQLWQNADAGRIYMAQPHGGAMAESGVSPQGYLVATADKLLVPTGRAVPAAMNRSDGKFLYYHLQANGRTGGTETMAAAGRFYNGGNAFGVDDGLLVEKLKPGNYAAISSASTPGAIVCGTSTGLQVLSVSETTAPDRKGKPVKTVKHAIAWSVTGVDASACVIVAGDLIICGGASEVTAVDTKTKKVAWTQAVDGAARSLAVAGSRLYVSTDQGIISCFAFGSHAPTEPAVVREVVPATRYSKFDAAAEEILRKSEIRDGFCLDLECTDGELLSSLATRTNLQIYALCPTDEEVAAVRRRLAPTGLYGKRITVHRGTLEINPYGKYFADLIVSSRSLDAGPLRYDEAAPPRVLHPFGGALVTGRPGEMQLHRRGALAGGGSWTHQYSDLGNTSCSTDDLVRGELHALWFRDVDLEMPQRHGRGPAPVYDKGRMFVEGVDALRAVDAYNGRSLWEFKMPGILAAYSADHLSGAAVTGSNLCVQGDDVYVHDKDNCYRLDAATGRKLGTFQPPPHRDGTPGQWGYLACDGDLLYGTLANPKHVVRFGWKKADMTDLWSESTAFFALNAKTGALRWRYDAADSIRHNAIAVGDDTVYLIDRKVSEEDKLDKAKLGADGKLPPVAKVNHPAGTLVALDKATGELRWKRPGAFGTMLVYSREHDALLMGYQSTRFKIPSEVGGRLAVYRGRTGDELWNKEAKYVTRPFINDDAVYAQGGAWELLTGVERPFQFDRSYGCGQISASKNLMLFRSATLGYRGLSPEAKSENFGGIRPGCWINALPVGGLVLLPDASAGCTCSYQNRSWMALEGDD